MAANDPIFAKALSTDLSPGVFWAGPPQQKVMAKLQEAHRELARIQQAARAFEREVRVASPTISRGGGYRSAETAAIARAAVAKQQLRDWVLSLVESIAYVEGMTNKNPNVLDQLRRLTSNAVHKGVGQASLDGHAY